MYSESAACVYCFCCKLFTVDAASSSGTMGFRSCKNISSRLGEFDKLPQHFFLILTFIMVSGGEGGTKILLPWAFATLRLALQTTYLFVKGPNI